MVPARLTVVTLGARDLARLRSFYSALGWEVAIEAEDFCAVVSRSVTSSGKTACRRKESPMSSSLVNVIAIIVRRSGAMSLKPC